MKTKPNDERRSVSGCVNILFFLIVFISLVNCQSIQKKSFENERGKNRTDRCMLREKNNCNGKKTVCQLHDKKGNEECRNEFDECVKNLFQNVKN